MRINIYILFCFIGHTFASVSKEESCLECYGVDKISLQSFKVYTKETARQRTEDYEEQGARPKQPRINQPETVIYPEDVDIISHRREGHSGEITNLSIQTTSVDNSEKLTPEYQQVGFKTSTRKDTLERRKRIDMLRNRIYPSSLASKSPQKPHNNGNKSCLPVTI